MLEEALVAASPRLSPERLGLKSLFIHGAVLAVWIVLLSRAFASDTIAAWSVGLAYIAYDTLLIAIVFRQTLPLIRARQDRIAAGLAPSLSVIVAAHDEAAVLPITVAALLAQDAPAEMILIADDGSCDATPQALRAFGLDQPAVGAVAASKTYPNLTWLRLPHGGKARALNAALLTLDTDLVVTVDADTRLDPGATAALRAAFAADARLVAATGILTPVCGPSLAGRFYEYFQTYEYIRNFLSRYAWGRVDALLLISGAFAAFRRDAVLRVGGFDPACMVEDYELIHRLRRYGARHGLGWTTNVVGGARAITDAPATTGAFLRQRRRWFCGFLQTQLWYREMVGDARYGRVGQFMLPIKAFDTLQPIYGLVSFVLLVVYIAEGRGVLLLPIGGVIASKIVIDFLFHMWSVHLYRRWVDPRTSAGPGRAVLASVLEPFTFQILRHLGAALGWVSFLTGRRTWGQQRRRGLVAARAPETTVAR
jgi:cellulose synthase/poly-beta-1,6-N-acetylglucosamine synthase-like glycosyltransferase